MGAMVKTEGKVCKMVSFERWKKTREQLNWFTQFLPDVKPLENCGLEIFDGDCPSGCIPHKETRLKRGFFGLCV